MTDKQTTEGGRGGRWRRESTGNTHLDAFKVKSLSRGHPNKVCHV